MPIDIEIQSKNYQLVKFDYFMKKFNRYFVYRWSGFYSISHHISRIYRRLLDDKSYSLIFGIYSTRLDWNNFSEYHGEFAVSKIKEIK